MKLIRESKQPYHEFNEEKRLDEQDPKRVANCKDMHSHHNLQKIFKLLWGNSSINEIAPRGSFVDLVFRIVLFHQSMLGVPQFRPVVPLNQEQQLLYLDPILYRLMLVMLICDSKSYTFLLDHEFTVENRRLFTIYIEL